MIVWAAGFGETVEECLCTAGAVCEKLNFVQGMRCPCVLRGGDRALQVSKPRRRWQQSNYGRLSNGHVDLSFYGFWSNA